MKLIVVHEDARVGPWVCARTDAGPYCPEVSTTIGLEYKGELVGGVVFDGWNGASICIHVASNGSKRWLNREFLWFVFHYAFEQLKVRKLIGRVADDNKAAMKFDLNLGFIEEAVIKDACRGGDLHIFTMTKEQCRWLGVRR
jgi:RimJ/RimL family protein N-acetyltransferase